MNLKEVVSAYVDQNDSVLDLGCGIYLSTKDLSCKLLVGMEIWRKHLETAQSSLPSNFVSLNVDIRKDLGMFLDKSFDVVLAIDSLEHCEEPLNILNEMERIARKQIVIYTPKSFEGNVQGKDCWAFGNPYNVHTSLIAPEVLRNRGYEISYPIPQDKSYLAVKRLKRPLFSIVIPAYIDSESDRDYLSSCLKSVYSQTFKNYEIVIIDDCSPIPFGVESSERRIRNEKNMGIGYSRQKGIEESKGEYVAFLSHDDWWEVDFLEEMSKHLDDKVLYGDIRIYEQGKFRNASLPSRENKSDFLKMAWDLAYKFWTFTHWSCMIFPKKFFKILPINKNLRIAEDYEWNLKASHLFSFEHIPKYLAIARYHEGMGSKGASYSTIDSEIIKEVKEWLKREGIE